MAIDLALPPALREYLFIDIEASGLQAGSYPIEVGWCGLDLAAASVLIRPHGSWGEADWSVTSERVHGITRDRVIADGADITAVAAHLNTLCAGRLVVSDRAAFDQAWLARLFDTAGTAQAFRLSDCAPLEAAAILEGGFDWEEVAELQERVRQVYPHPHRAAPDARQAAALFLAAALPDAINAILAAAGDA